MSEEFNNVDEQIQEEPIQSEYGYYENPYVAAEPQPMVEAPKSNLIAGLVGAFLGSLIGAVVWVLIYKIGFIAGLAGAVTAICAMKGYEMFGKCLDKKGVICCVLIAIITIFLANKLSWAWAIFDDFKNAGYEISFFDAFINADEIIELSENTGYYYKDLIIGYALTAWASYKDIINAFKAAK